MRYLVWTSEEGALAFSAAVDGALGYPKPGHNVGAGEHVDSDASETLHYADIVKRPDGEQWAYPSDAIVDGLALVPPIAPDEELAQLPGWFPPASIAGS